VTLLGGRLEGRSSHEPGLPCGATGQRRDRSLLQMMRCAVISIFILIVVCNGVLGFSRNTIAKRYVCSSSGCNTCDGKKCNSCNKDNECCSSVSCNQCVNQCTNDCSTVSCRNNCVSGCKSSCQSQSCDVQSCSQCVNKCSNDCSSNQCTNECSKSCDCTEKDTRPGEPVILDSGEPASVIVNNSNVNLVNLTTHINIDNVIHNINNISIPVYVNTTNINNINLSDIREESNTGDPRPAPVVPYPYPYPLTQPTTTNNCCQVLHPRRCYTDEDGTGRCYIRRHNECSDRCTSPVVTIEENQNAQSGCQYIRSWPYAYCGNYVRGDCNQCYNCGGGYNPRECFRSSGCSDVCRRSAPNCVPSQSGLQCY
jgi:hypothetical protein